MIIAQAVSGVSSILSRVPPYRMLTKLPPSTKTLDAVVDDHSDEQSIIVREVNN